MNSFKKHFGGLKEIIYLSNIYKKKYRKKNANGLRAVQLFDLTHIQFRAWTAYILSRILTSKIIAIGLTADERLIWNDNKNAVRAAIRLTSPFRISINRFFDKIIHIDRVRIKSQLDAQQIKFNSKWDLLSYEFEGVKIGDLIYDTYLKRFKKPTVNINDERLYQLVTEAISIHRKFSALIDENHIKVIYLTHSAYIFYGVIARVALCKGAQVYLFGNSRTGDSRELHLNDWHQLPGVDNRLKHFEALSASEMRKYTDVAKEILRSRFSGKIDQLISYMKVQPYSEINADEEPAVLDKTLILYLHDFFDSPHVYGDMLFPDFYEWIIFVAAWSRKNGIKLLLKKHPNAIPGNDDIIAEIVSGSDNIEIISSGDAISLTKKYPNALFLSVYGTCTQEIAFNSGKILLAGANPYMRSSMAMTANSVDEYECCLQAWLHDSCNIKMDSREPFYTMAAYFLAGNEKKYPSTMNNTDLRDINIDF